MSNGKRKYTAEFKREAVSLANESDRPLAEVAQNLGISRGVLHRWKSEMKARGDVQSPAGIRARASEEELARLRKQLARAEQERDILKKALAYFAKERT